MPPIFWLIIALNILLPLPIIYFVACKRLGPEADKRRCLAILPILLGTWIVMPAVFFLLDRAWLNNHFAAFQFGIAGLCALLMLYLWYRRRQSGALLFDLGPLRRRTLLLVLSVVFFAIFVAFTIFEIAIGIFDIEDLARLVLLTTLMANNILIFSSRTQIREYGLLTRGDLLRWEKIGGYGWEPSTPNVLVLKTISCLRAFGKSSIPVPPQHRDQVEAVIAQHIGRVSRKR